MAAAFPQFCLVLPENKFTREVGHQLVFAIQFWTFFLVPNFLRSEFLSHLATRDATRTPSLLLLESCFTYGEVTVHENTQILKIFWYLSASFSITKYKSYFNLFYLNAGISLGIESLKFHNK